MKENFENYTQQKEKEICKVTKTIQGIEDS